MKLNNYFSSEWKRLMGNTSHTEEKNEKENKKRKTGSSMESFASVWNASLSQTAKIKDNAQRKLKFSHSWIKNFHIGKATNILDAYKRQIKGGSRVKFVGKNSITEGIILFVQRLNKWCFCSGMSDGNGNIYNDESYWNIIPINESYSANLILI